MSATPSPPSAVTSAPSQVELLWERYKSLAYVVIFGAIAALGINYAIKYFNRKQVDTTWSTFAENLGLRTTYTDEAKPFESLIDSVRAQDAAKLRSALEAATPEQKPFVLLALSARAILDQDWEAAEKHLTELEKGYPNHSLVRSTAHPVQAQEVIKDLSPPSQPPARPRKPQFRPAQEGSVVGLLRAQIAQIRGYSPPPQFAKPTIPADATKVRFELSGDYGSFTLALMPDAPKHREAFLKLVESKFWEGIAVDEIRRPVRFNKQPHELHIGFESTKSDDRDEWRDMEPSKHVVEFERNSLSHFPGAVSARNEADGKSCADRFWIVVDDAPRYDGDRVVFAYVVDGLENLRRVCEATMRTTQEDEQGRGKTSDVIRVTGVSLVP
jgi:cyclophilin family peptidyl-prolyl cis-trans isomerase